METTAKPRSPYFVNPWVDSLAIGGASILIYLLVYLFSAGDRTPLTIQVAGFLLWIINWPHFSATNFRLYRSRETMMEYPLTSFLIPLIVLAGVAFSFTHPVVVAPMFVKLFLWWSPYHFSAQSLGIFLLYCRRADFQLDRLARTLITVFLFCSFLIPVFMSEVGRSFYPFYTIGVPSLGLSAWVPDFFRYLMLVTGVLFVARLAQTRGKGIMAIPLIVFLPVLTQVCWYQLGLNRAAYNDFVPMFHSLQYLFIAWVVFAADQKMRSTKPFQLWKTSSLWFVFNIGGGALLFFILPRVLSHLTGQAVGFSTAIVLAAVQIHHFFVDGVIWKLRRRTVSSPLMMSYGDFKS